MSGLREYRRIFDLFDKSNEGIICISDLPDAFKGLTKDMSDQDILKMMSKTGLEGNKVVDFDEFVKLIHQSENQEEEEEENKEEAEPETEGNDQDESTMEANEDEKDQDTEGGKDLIEIKTTPTDFIQKSPKKSPINPRAARFNQY